MNPKLKADLVSCWNEPRRFFLYLMLLSLFFVGFVMLVTSILQRPVAIVLVIGLIAAGVAVISLCCFLLALIPSVRRLLSGMLRRRFFVLACLVTLIALFYAEEDIRGRVAWKAYVSARAVKGDEVRGFTQLAPPRIPDEQNFAAAPVFEDIRKRFDMAWVHAHTGAAVFKPNQLPAGPDRTDLTGSMTGLQTWKIGRRTDLRAWQTYYRRPSTKSPEKWQTPVKFPVSPSPHAPAPDVLLALSVYRQGIEALQAASTRPLSRFPIHYEDGDSALLPHLAELKKCNQTLALKAVAELAEDKTDAALADVKLSMRLIASIRTEPLLISQLVRISMLTTTLQAVWEGFVAHKWTEAQIRALEDELKELDFIADWQYAVNGERGFCIWIANHLQQTRDMRVFGAGEAWAPQALPIVVQVAIFHSEPGGWFEQNKLRCSRMLTEDVAPLIEPGTRRVDFDLLGRANDRLDYMDTHRGPYNHLVSLLVPAVNNSVKRFAYGQTCVNLARTAGALECYRFANSDYPATLARLSPEFLTSLPHDVITGNPLTYKRISSDRYVIYSVGWNLKDDGGEPGGLKKLDVGDWVWRFPEE